MKYLLIDDLAKKGWKSVLEKAVLKESNQLDIAETIEEAKDKIISKKYDIIFLDVRLTKSDHSKNKKVEEYSGFKILEELKSKFWNKNYSTPIILLTASNKIWNIDKFKQNGVDAFYIKEHPDYIYSKDTSFANLRKLQKDFKYCFETGEQRKKVWDLIYAIKGTYKNKIINRNIQGRLIDKLKVGYSLLFTSLSEHNKKMFVSQNEILAFVVFWSILEEIAKAIYDDNWDKEKGRMNNNCWKLPNNEYLIREINNESFEVGISINNNNPRKETEQIDVVNIGKIKGVTYNKYDEIIYLSLSFQIYGICLLNNYDNPKELVTNFKKLNAYRNKIDFIHSDINAIFTENLGENYKPKQVYDKCIEMLSFIKDIVS